MVKITETGSLGELAEVRDLSADLDSDMRDRNASPDIPEFVQALMQDPVVETLMSVAAAFHNSETGKAWLLTPTQILGDAAPISLILTKEGRDRVLNELGIIAHGMF